jgi:CBS domain-containing protein
MKVSKVMRKAIVIDDSISVKEVARIMSKKNIGSLIVVRKNKIVGIITERDVMKNISKLDEKVKKVMSKKVRTINSEEEIERAAEILSLYSIKRLPVVSNKELKGIVTMTDILGHCGNMDQISEDFLIN